MKWYWILLIAVGTFLIGWWIGSMKKASLPAVTTKTTTLPNGEVVNQTTTGTGDPK